MKVKNVLKAILYSAFDFITLYYMPIYFVNLFSAQGVTLPKFNPDVLLYLSAIIATLTFIAVALGGIKGAMFDFVKVFPRVFYTIEMFSMISEISIVIVQDNIKLQMIVTVDFGLIFWLTILSILLGAIRGILNKYYEHLKEKEAKEKEIPEFEDIRVEILR